MPAAKRKTSPRRKTSNQKKKAGGARKRSPSPPRSVRNKKKYMSSPQRRSFKRQRKADLQSAAMIAGADVLAKDRISDLAHKMSANQQIGALTTLGLSVPTIIYLLHKWHQKGTSDTEKRADIQTNIKLGKKNTYHREAPRGLSSLTSQTL